MIVNIIVSSSNSLRVNLLMDSIDYGFDEQEDRPTKFLTRGCILTFTSKERGKVSLELIEREEFDYLLLKARILILSVGLEVL